MLANVSGSVKTSSANVEMSKHVSHKKFLEVPSDKDTPNRWNLEGFSIILENPASISISSIHNER
jgi:hypothetical protein